MITCHCTKLNFHLCTLGTLLFLPPSLLPFPPSPSLLPLLPLPPFSLPSLPSPSPYSCNQTEEINIAFFLFPGGKHFVKWMYYNDVKLHDQFNSTYSMHTAVLVAIQQTSPLPLPSPPLPSLLSQPMHSLLKQKRDHITLVELGCKVQWCPLLLVKIVNDVQPRVEKGGSDFNEPMTSGKV